MSHGMSKLIHIQLSDLMRTLRKYSCELQLWSHICLLLSNSQIERFENKVWPLNTCTRAHSHRNKDRQTHWRWWNNNQPYESSGEVGLKQHCVFFRHAKAAGHQSDQTKLCPLSDSDKSIHSEIFARTHPDGLLTTSIEAFIKSQVKFKVELYTESSMKLSNFIKGF